MSNDALFSRERFSLTMNHEQPDRPPVNFSATAEILKALDTHIKGLGFKGSVADLFSVDFHCIYDHYRGKPRPVPEGCDRADQWGAGYKNSEDTYQHCHYLPFAHMTTMDDVHNYDWPDPEDFDVSHFDEEIGKHRDKVIAAGGWHFFDIINGIGYRGRGGEQIMVDILTEDEVGCAIIDRHLDIQFRVVTRMLEAGNGRIDILQVGEDSGTQLNSLFSPEVFKRFFAPRFKRFADAAHSYGAKVKLHSCGSYRNLFPLYIDDVGIDILGVQPEPANMDMAELKAEFGDKVVLSEGISIQDILIKKTPEECAAHAADVISAAGKGGGYIFGPPNTLTRDVPLENILAMYEACLGG